MPKLRSSVTAAVLVNLAIGAAAGAQTVAAAGADGVLVGDVVVTTQRRTQNPVDVPIALSALSGETLSRLRVSDLHDLSTFTPGLLVQNKSAADSRFIMRGIGSDDGSSYQEPRVSVFLDGASISKSRGAFVELFDLERVEVARGPQTTLFGQGALIGAVNLIQNKADPKAVDWRFAGEYGGYDSRLASGMANLPLGQSLAVRVSGQYRGRDGYVRNVLGGEDFGGFEVAAGRIALAWRPSAALSADLIYNRQHDSGSGQSYKSGVFYPADPATGAVLAGLAPSDGAALAAGPGFGGGRPLGLKRDVSSLSATLVWRRSETMSFTSITAWRRFEGQQILDFDGFAFPLLTVGDDTVGEQISQELRANLQPSKRVDIVAGVNLSRDQGHQRTPLGIDERLVLSLLAGGLDRSNPTLAPLSAYVGAQAQAGLLQRLAAGRGASLTDARALGIAANLDAAHQEVYEDTASNRVYDAYLDVSFAVTPRLRLAAGGRYSYSDRDAGLSAGLPTGRSVLAGVIAALGRTEPTRTALLSALSLPGASTAAGPVPLVGLRVQPTAGNGSIQKDSLGNGGGAWRLTARYRLRDGAAVYANYARGRRPRLLSPLIPSAPLGPVVFNRVAAETVDSYETGVKLRDVSSGLSLDAAAYTYRYAHFQTVVQQGAQFVTADAGRASNTGLEVEASWRPARGLRLFGNYTLSHGRFRDGLYRGNHLALSPDHAATVGLETERQALGGVVRLAPTLRYTSRIYFTDDNADPALTTGAFVKPLGFAGSQGGYAVADLRLDYAPASGRWSVGLFASNLFDRRYVKEAGNGGQDFGLPTYIAGDPRVVGVSASLRR